MCVNYCLFFKYFVYTSHFFFLFLFLTYVHIKSAAGKERRTFFLKDGCESVLFSKVEVDCIVCFMVYDHIRMYSIGFTSEK